MIKKIIHKIKRVFSNNEINRLRKLGVKVGSNCRLLNVSLSSEPYLISIGNHVSLTDVHFETHDGAVWIFREKEPEIDVILPIKIGNNVFIGKGCIILPGVNIDDNVIVGAYSVITKNLASGYVYAGTPARKIKTIAEYRTGIESKIHNTKFLSLEEKRAFYGKIFQ